MALTKARLLKHDFPVHGMISFKSFTKELADKGGWRTKGVGGQSGLVRRDPSCARDSDLFSAPFFLIPSLGQGGTQFWGTIFAVIGDRQTCTIPTKDYPHQVVFLGGRGVLCELSKPKKKAKYAPPPVLHSRC